MEKWSSGLREKQMQRLSNKNIFDMTKGINEYNLDEACIETSLLQY